jgi:hypothetical protein
MRQKVKARSAAKNIAVKMLVKFMEAWSLAQKRGRRKPGPKGTGGYQGEARQSPECPQALRVTVLSAIASQ